MVDISTCTFCARAQYGRFFCEQRRPNNHSRSGFVYVLFSRVPLHSVLRHHTYIRGICNKPLFTLVILVVTIHLSFVTSDPPVSYLSVTSQPSPLTLYIPCALLIFSMSADAVFVG